MSGAVVEVSVKENRIMRLIGALYLVRPVMQDSNASAYECAGGIEYLESDPPSGIVRRIEN